MKQPQRPMSRSRIHKAQLKLVDAMVDIERFRDHTCAKCGKAFGPIGVRGISFRTNAQHMGDVVVELQCPHCDVGYDLHYRRVVDSMGGFASFLDDLWMDDDRDKGERLTLQKPVNSFDIRPQDNNLISIMQEALTAKAKQGGKGKKP